MMILKYKYALAIIAALLFLAGAANGLMDALQFHGAAEHFDNDQFWNPKISHLNKWAISPEGVTMIGVERFWGSSRWFVAVTDGWHLAKFFHLNLLKAAIVAAWVLRLTSFGLKGNPWWVQMLVVVGYFTGITLAMSAGFHLVYSFILG